MPRKKGDGKGKTGGRQRGSTNLVNRTAKEILANIVEKKLTSGEVERWIDEIDDPKDRTNCFVKLMEFYLPKQAAVHVTDDTKQSDLQAEIQAEAARES